ncbi:DUF6520 family protein [Sinomicrobium sp. M5D2P17]
MIIKYQILNLLVFSIAIGGAFAYSSNNSYWYRVIESNPSMNKPIAVDCDQIPTYQCRVITEIGVRKVWNDTATTRFAFHSSGEALLPF